MDVELLAYFLSVIVSFHILTQRRSAPSIIAWLLGLIVAPLATSIIYMLVGRRKFNFNTLKSMPKMERTPNDLKALNHIDQLLQNIGIAPASGDNEIELITSSTKAHKELINSIKEAKYSIDIETYILKPDKIGKEIIGELEKKAKEGVRVRVLLDAIGSLYLYFYRKPLKRLIDSGGEVIFFMPPNFLLFRWLINLRDHRKIYLFDREILYSGGMNLAYEYLGEDNHPKVWKDLLFKAKGTIVYRYLSVFEADFSFAKNIEYIAPEIPLKREIFKGAILQPVPSGPDMEKDTLLESILEAISKAKERVWIVTPYLIIDEPLFEAFKIASHRGVDIKIITPLKSDHLFIDLARGSYLRELSEEGIEILLYLDKMLHAKGMIFDNEASLIGSVNLDNRSLLLNYEIATFGYSKEVILEMEKWMKSLMENTTIYKDKSSPFKVVLENLFRIFAPIL